jgi:L-cysteate sulfo-lyase
MERALGPLTLGTWPTPLEPARRLSVELGLLADDLWIKRDDLTGLGGGGNKVRKLQHTCAAAIAKGATTLITCGAAQSNNARLTAAAGAHLGLDVILVLAGDPDGPTAGNVALDGLLGATVVWAKDADDIEMQAEAEALARRLAAKGVVAEVLPYGGSSVEGARGYVDGGRELLEQAPDLEHVVVAVGSGGTMAGLVHKLGAERVLGVHTGAVADPRSRVQALVDGLADPGRSSRERPSLRLRLDQVGDGYSHLTPESRRALLAAARTEGILLDPVYTGRALAGLKAEIAEGAIRPGQRTVFLHSGGVPGLFGLADLGSFAPRSATT